MRRYLLSVIEPAGDGPAPPEVDLEAIGRGMAEIERELKEQGSWVFAGGLHPPSSATTVRVREGEIDMSDGPFVETKEHVGGFTVLRADDLDSALRWAARYAGVIGLPIEVRPFREEG